MKISWYYYRLRKMHLSEILKRVDEYIYIYKTKIKYRNPQKWPYSRFSNNLSGIVLKKLPKEEIKLNWQNYHIYNKPFDLTKKIEWYFTEAKQICWPKIFYNDIDYRPGNPYGDIRINWELNRLQFIPLIATDNEELAKKILKSWLKETPYLYGPSYVSSMEVALRWISVYWGVCLLSNPIEKSLSRELTGLAVASGIFIENRLSTHSSAGNHILVEAVGLFWIATALQSNACSNKWRTLARNLIWEQTLRQLNFDGSPKEQSFWYLGFVLDALFYYFLIEDISIIPKDILIRVEKSLGFISNTTLLDGTFPDYGDRDDGYVGHIDDDYKRSPFVDLLKIGSRLFNRPEWVRGRSHISRKPLFFTSIIPVNYSKKKIIIKDPGQHHSLDRDFVKSYPDGGITIFQKGKGRLIFKHSPLGLEPTYGHGHSDALSIIFSWGEHQILCDLGSGQYNGDQKIRNFFRSTLAHNTIQVADCNQAKILGPFLWDESYNCLKTNRHHEPNNCVVEYKHDGYLKRFGVTHNRKIKWKDKYKIYITDILEGEGEISFSGTFHFHSGCHIELDNNILEVSCEKLKLLILFDNNLDLNLFSGSEKPFLGWKSTIYGGWDKINTICFGSRLKHVKKFDTVIEIIDN